MIIKTHSRIIINRKNSDIKLDQKRVKEMKKTLFGGMKIKGPSGGKAQQPKEKPAQSQTNLSNDSHQQAQQNAVLNMTKAQTQQSPMSTIPQIKPQLKHGKTSLQTVLRQQQPTMQRKQSMKQGQPKNISSAKDISRPNNAQKQSSKNEKQNTNEQQNESDISYPQQNYRAAKKEVNINKKSLSERDYNQDSEGREEVREDRSVVVGNYRPDEDKQEVEVNKSYKSTKPAPKSNPILNQLKKINKNSEKTKDISQKQKQKQKNNNKKPIGPGASSTKSTNQPSKRQKSTVMQQLSSSHTRLIQSILKKKQAKQHTIQLSCSIIELKQNLSVLINRQNHYIATEDYQQADKLQSQIQTITGTISQQQIEMNFTQQALNQLQHEGVGLLKSHLEEEKRTIRRIKLIQLDIEDEISHYKREQQSKISQTKLVSQQQNKKLANITNNLNKHTELYKQYQTNLKNEMNEKKQPLEKLLTQQEQKKAQLESSIKQLEQKLKKKKNLLKATLSSIQSTRNKLNQVDTEYQQQRQTLKQKQHQIQKLQKDKLTHSKKLKQIQSQISRMETAKDTQINSMTVQKESYHKLSTNLEQFFQTTDVDYYLKQKKRIIEEYIRHSVELREFEERHREKRERVKELELEKSTLESQTVKREQKIKELKSKIPLLEQEQKQLSMVKNFKGAGMKKAQIVQCQQEINKVKKSIQESFGREAQLQQEIQTIRKQQQQHVEEENRLRRQLAVSQYRLGVEKRRQIRKQLQWLSGLRIDDKGRLMYEDKLLEQLQSLQQEITYIAQEYELQQQEQKQASKNNGQQQRQKQMAKSTKGKLQSIPHNQPRVQQASSYIPLTLNDNEQQLKQQKDNSSSNNHLQSSSYKSQQHSGEEEQQNQYNQLNQQQQQQQQQQGEQQEEQQQDNQQIQQQEQRSSSHDQQPSTYQPLSIDDNTNNQDTNTNQLQQSEESESQQQQHQQHHESQQQEQQQAGYVPLQLD